MTTTFRELGILSETAEALEAVGIINPFPIQEMTLPVALSGSDVIGQAKTGTGKTLGFGLPLLERVTVPADVEAGRARPDQLTDAPQALVVVPTRELCTQVTNDLLTAGKVRNVRVLAIYGGRAYEPQVEALNKGVDVIVGTPGRLLDLAGQRKLDLSHVKALVLDEADEMLDLGFLPDVEKIINMLPARRQTMLFSATMPGAVIGLARRYMSQPTHIRATAPDDSGATVANITQHVYRAHSMDKPEMVSRILQAEGRGLAMIFCRTKRTAADIAEQLERRGFASGAVHGDLGQGAREQALRAFRNGKVDVLVCTDVAARGIDVEGVTHVINYQSPEDEKTYLHRVGRTGRAGASGTAITLVDWDDIPRWQLINKALELGFNDPPETYSTSPHLYSDLDIAEGTKGILPRAERTRAGLDAEELEDLGETGGRGRSGRPPRSSSRSSEGSRSSDGFRSSDGSGRSGRPSERTEERPARTRTPRRRRRTRGGEAVGSAPVAETVAPAPTAPVAPVTPVAPAEDGSTAPRTPRRRRRTRSNAPSAAVTATATVAIPAQAAEAKPVAVAEPVAVVEPVTVPEPVAAEEPAAPAKPRRTRKKAVAEAAAPVTEAPVEAEAKPRRTRKKAVAAVEPTPEAAEAPVETEAKPRRTRKKTVAEPAAPVTETPAETEAKPRRTRKKAVAAVEPTPETTEAPAETEAKPRRTRKKAVAAVEPTPEAAEAPVEAEAKPRRTRKKAVAEPVAAVAEAPAEAEAKPRRTRKKAVAEAAAPVTETPAETEAKPRRTRKKAVAAVEPTPEIAEAEVKPRRTRKKAVAAQPEQPAG
ncbi:DEAD/DEAH box helicase [Streptomyces sp. NPDC047097]|uniref:DEAD/DEAH box helicase n=1 Tax=Streptomyces sp. NPDC047097 TaxID=3155260 RepID=UPI0033DB579A